jgi:hypothetical protein
MLYCVANSCLHTQHAGTLTVLVNSMYLSSVRLFVNQGFFLEAVRVVFFK